MTWKGRTSAVGGSAALPVVTITDSMRCRIAHLAVCPKARRLINLIYGPKNERENLDDYNLRVGQLWAEVADQFGNAAAWMPESSVEYYSLFDNIDTTVAPPQPGLDVATIKNTWMTIRTEWSRLVNALYSPTGASGTAGDVLYKNAYENFICGTRMQFNNKPVTMYVFMLWISSGTTLPQWCNRTLNPKAQLRVGVDGDAPSFMSPDKSKGTASTGSTPPSAPALDKLVSLLQSRWEGKGTAELPTDPEAVRALRMTHVQTQLTALYAAKSMNERGGKCTSGIDAAIDRLNAKLVELVE